MSSVNQARLKAIIRREMLQKRRALSSVDCRNKSLAIAKRLIASNLFQRADYIQIYLSNSEEVQSDFLIQEAHRLKKRVLVPVVEARERRMFFSELPALAPEVFEAGPFGIRQPKAGFQKKIDPHEIALWVLPGLAFDPQGNRIGYGGGYYDKVLKEVQMSVIGLAFELQLMDKVPVELTDCSLDQIITETRILLCRKEA